MIRLPAVSLTDPWASLVVAGVKTLETRIGPLLSGFSGPLVIHRTLAKCVPYDLSRWGVSLPPRPHRCAPVICDEDGCGTEVQGWDCDGEEGMGLCWEHGERYRYHSDDDDATLWPEDDRGMALGIVYVEGTSRLTMEGSPDLRMFSPRPTAPTWLSAPLADLRRRACFEDIERRYLSELTRAAWFPMPIKARGMQCWWSIEVPREYLPAWARGER